MSAKVKVSDFGSAILVCDEGMLLSTPTGTPAFMAPEMCSGGQVGRARRIGMGFWMGLCGGSSCNVMWLCCDAVVLSHALDHMSKITCQDPFKDLR